MKYIEVNIELERQDSELERLIDLGVSVDEDISWFKTKIPLNSIHGWIEEDGKAAIFWGTSSPSSLLDITVEELEYLIKNPKEL